MNELTDLSPMPFGKHKGEPMQDVPAAYLRPDRLEDMAKAPGKAGSIPARAHRKPPATYYANKHTSP